MIRSYGPPDSGTPGNVGDLYIDAKTEEMYRCVKVIPDIVNQKNQFVTNYVHGPNTQYFWEKEQNIEFVVPDNCKIFNSFNNADNTVNRLISHIRIPEGIEEIGTSCFTGCHVKTVYLPKSLKTISSNSFSGTGYLKYLTIPGGVLHIGVYAFSGSGIESLYIEDGLQELTEKSLANMVFLKEVRLPNTLISIGSNCFNGCYSITKISIPNSVDTIDSSAFSSPGINEIIIDKPEGSISGAPWGANSECTITWPR